MPEMSKHDAMFVQLIMTFQSTAWVQMGKVKNPHTDKMEKDTNQAQYSIDMLDMLSAKTKGNLNDEEDKMLKNILTNLKMNFVEVLEQEKKETVSQKPEADEKKTEKKDEES